MPTSKMVVVIKIVLLVGISKVINKPLLLHFNKNLGYIKKAAPGKEQLNYIKTDNINTILFQKP